MATTRAVTLEFDDSEFRRLVAAGDRTYRKAAVRALNRTAQSARGRTARSTAGALRVPLGKLRRRTYVRNATFRRLEAVIKFYVRPLNPISLGAKQTRKGVSGLGRHWDRSFHHKGHRRRQLQRVALQREAGADRYPVNAIKIAFEGLATTILGKVVDRAWRSIFEREYPRQLAFALRQAAHTGAF